MHPELIITLTFFSRPAVPGGLLKTLNYFNSAFIKSGGGGSQHSGKCQQQERERARAHQRGRLWGTKDGGILDHAAQCRDLCSPPPQQKPTEITSAPRAAALHQHPEVTRPGPHRPLIILGFGSFCFFFFPPECVCMQNAKNKTKQMIVEEITSAATQLPPQNRQITPELRVCVTVCRSPAQCLPCGVGCTLTLTRVSKRQIAAARTLLLRRN